MSAAGNKYDFRSNLKKVDLSQPRSPTAPVVADFAQQPLAFRPYQASNGQSVTQSLKPSASVASRSSSVYSTRQSQYDSLESSPTIQRSPTIPRSHADTTTSQPAVAPSAKAPSIYSQRSVSDAVHGPKHLLVISAGGLVTDLQQYIHTSVIRHDIGSVILLGSDEEAIKRSKMDCYTVAGKLEKNLSVSTSIVKGTNDIDSLAQSLQSLQNRNIHGVLCFLGPSISEDDILDLDQGDMTSAWRSSILTLQTIAKHTVPLLARNQAQNNNMRTYLGSPFFATQQEQDTNAVPSFHSTAQNVLLQSIARSPIANGVRLGSADEILPPPPPPSVARSSSPQPSVSTPNIDIPHANGGARTTERVDVPANMSESPTKLWALYANAMSDV